MKMDFQACGIKVVYHSYTQNKNLSISIYQYWVLKTFAFPAFSCINS